jgi:hypothetical protein
MSWLFGLLTSIPGFLNGLLSYLQKKQDAAVIQNGNAKDVGIAVVQSEVSRLQAAASVLQVAMSHPVFWVAWGIGVFPVMLYYGTILTVSTFPFAWEALTGIPAKRAVLEAPADAIAFAHQITNWMFGIAGASSLVAGVAQAWAKRA